jgi:antagonist of KipI
MTVVEIQKAGPLSTFQDLGRVGHQHQGVRVCGVMDTFASRIANRLAGNADDCAVIEYTLVGDTLKFNTSATVAITGADAECRIDGQRQPLWQTLSIKAGSTLTIGGMAWGVRAYLAIAGGWSIPNILGSVSTDLVAEFGGLNGRALKKGDSLLVNQRESTETLAFKTLSANRYREVYRREQEVIPLRVLLGPDNEHFHSRFLSALDHLQFQVSSDSNRQGITMDCQHFEGPIHSALGPDIISSFTTFGTIQVPRHGRPTVLMADRQSTGGFARLAKIIDADLPLFAQCRPGQLVCFVPVSVAEARAAKAYQGAIIDSLDGE